MRIALPIVGALVLALGVTSPAGAAEIRLLPPVLQASPTVTPASVQADQERALRIVRERHPEVFDESSAAGRYVVSVVLRADGSVERTEARRVDTADPGSAMQQMWSQISQDVDRTSTMFLRKGGRLPDGTIINSEVMLQLASIAPGYDPTRAVSRVQSIVRQRHADLLLPVGGEVLNRLTIFLNDSGQIERESVEQIRFDSLRSAPLEDEHFAERMAERFTQTLGLDVRQIGVVGFTYVEDSSESNDRRTLLVQYAWVRKPGDKGPSMPMAARAQQQPRVFDEAAALALAEQHFAEAFASPETAAGTPTIVLNMQGEVLRVGRVQYRSGQIHETSLQQQLMPGVRLERLISPTLKDARGGTAVITFAWVNSPAR